MSSLIPKLSSHTDPLRKQLHKDVACRCTETHDQVFQTVKNLVHKEMTLSYYAYDPHAATVLDVDSSLTRIGAFLFEDGKPTTFTRKSMADKESSCAIQYKAGKINGLRRLFVKNTGADSGNDDVEEDAIVEGGIRVNQRDKSPVPTLERQNSIASTSTIPSGGIVHTQATTPGVSKRFEAFRPHLYAIVTGNVRSLTNEVDEISSSTRYLSKYREAGIVCITETWLCDSCPDSCVNRDGLSVFRSDLTPDSGKTRGGGVCAYINSKWCNNNNIHVADRTCTPYTEVLSLRIRHYYLSREFPKINLYEV
ncbi:hypothetical protein RRG08_030088 [Elysia crispata]|uniref:Uncharacterized protein n=1 Tax=Elysia crispata TaxID=231223 RepID=A0AAE0ZS43_9GAST|nr:hypothetical protein RRG08_030088 [Elysia crispata]